MTGHFSPDMIGQVVEIKISRTETERSVNSYIPPKEIVRTTTIVGTLTTYVITPDGAEKFSFGDFDLQPLRNKEHGAKVEVTVFRKGSTAPIRRV